MIVSVVAIVSVAASDPIAQDSAYHAFADSRTILAVPNFWNVVSNAFFVLVGAIGTVRLLRGTPRGVHPGLRRAWLTCFVATTLVGVGSAAYHLRPTDDSLVWDRLPMTVALMAFFAVVLGERIDLELGAKSLLPLMILGASSVAYWHFTEVRGRGDLRPYAVVQYLPLLLVPLILVLFPHHSARGRLYWTALGGYALAKAFEVLDRFVFDLTNFMSGHPLKHLAAAAALSVLLVAMDREDPVEEPSPL